MPQNRRKTPFSGKKKKDQLQQKRQMKGTQKYLRTTSDDGDTTEDTEFTAKKLMEQPMSRNNGGRNKNVNRYNLQFYQECKRDLELQKLSGFTSLAKLPPEMREIDANYFNDYDFPIRPEWTYEMSKEVLDRNENRYFREYVNKLQVLHKQKNAEHSLFELNLETWRQLWRVLELSDILLIIVDIRYATLMFPPALYEHVTKNLSKHAILVLNKVDLVAPETVVAWREYFKATYPGLPIVIFASYPTVFKSSSKRGRTRFNRCMDGVHNIYRECRKIVQSAVDLSSWEQKINDDMRLEGMSCAETTESDAAAGDEHAKDDVHPTKQTMFNDGILTIGCIGFPNVGKSTLLNALKGRKVVSVSRTPGHTKHFQTIFLTNQVRLCDCPGLVFPSSTPKYMQVLLGSYPISQLQVPYKPLKFLAEHLDLPGILKLNLPPDFDDWSAIAIAEAWALKRGFLTAKAARPDRYRAANNLLRMCLAGLQQLVLQFYPPAFHANKDKFLNHPDMDEVKKFQHIETDEENDQENDTSSMDSDSEDSDGASSYDETNADEADEEGNDSETLPTRPRNTFALLEHDAE